MYASGGEPAGVRQWSNEYLHQKADPCDVSSGYGMVERCVAESTVADQMHQRVTE